MSKKAPPIAVIESADQNRRTRLKARRKLWLDLHLYVGLVAGAMLVVIGLTGSILVFWHEVDEWIDPQLRIVDVRPGGERAFTPLANIERAVVAATPAGAVVTHIWTPRHARGCYLVYYNLNDDTRRFCIDPYDASRTADRLYYSKDSPFRHALMGFIFQLHWCLLLSDLIDDGGDIVGVAAVLLIVSSLAGLYLWWPSPGKWLSALTLKRGAKAERLNYDLHKIGGVYTLAVLVAVLLSGVYMNLREPFLWVVDHIAPLTAHGNEEYRSQSADGRSPIGFTAAVDAAMRASPDGRFDRVNLSTDEMGVYEIWQTDVPDVSRFIQWRSVYVDQYSGAVVHIGDIAHGTGGDAFLRWQWPLHSGQAFGLTGRLLVLLTGLVCPLLFVTGVIRWLQKRRARGGRCSTHETRLSGMAG